MPLLGLLDAEQFSAQRFKNVRRSVFYYYPNGATPLIGLLSLLDEEDTNDPEFYWHEKVKDDQASKTVANTTGPFIVASQTGADVASPWSPAQDSVCWVIVEDPTKFRVGHLVKIPVNLNGGATAEFMGLVTEVLRGNAGAATTKNALKLKLVFGGYAAVLNTAANVGVEVLIVGNAAAEGQIGAATTPWNLPKQIGNYTQIMRTAFNFTGTAGKTSAIFDESGPYKDKSKEATINHNQEMEKNFIFGRQRKTTDPTNNALPLRFMGGVIWFLEQWELTANNPYGGTGATLDTDDNKRIIQNSTGTVNEKSYDKMLERLFRVTNNKTNEKLVLCGSGFLMVINQLYRNKSVLNVQQGSKDLTYGMTVVSHLTSFGTVHYRTHPLFSENSIMRFSALFLDVHNLKYRYMQGRDTMLLKNRQPNNADYREDEFLTECSLELRMPQSHMFMKNVLDSN